VLPQGNRAMSKPFRFNVRQPNELNQTKQIVCVVKSRFEHESMYDLFD